MTDYEKLSQLIEDDKVKYGLNLPKDLHTKLVLGQTRYVCRYGTLSDGHEKITPAQRYYQAIKEIYSLSMSIRDQRAYGMEAQADLLDAEESLLRVANLGLPEQAKLRAEASCIKARSRLTQSLVTVQDQLRMLDEYDMVRRELESHVEEKYPLGVEQAEQDNWIAVFEYRMRKGHENISNIPLDPVTKAQLGYEYYRVDAIAPLELSDPTLCKQIAHQYETHIHNQAYSERKLLVENK